MLFVYMYYILQCIVIIILNIFNLILSRVYHCVLRVIIFNEFSIEMSLNQFYNRGPRALFAPGFSDLAAGRWKWPLASASSYVINAIRSILTSANCKNLEDVRCSSLRTIETWTKSNSRHALQIITANEFRSHRRR